LKAYESQSGRKRLGLLAMTLVAALAIAAANAEGAGTEVAARPASAGQDFGPYTCLVGYVWREATSSDLVCVLPDVRTQTKQDNALATSRRSPNGGSFGPDTCLTGYVWREAVTNDHVCVPPATRDQAKADNAAAASRRNDLRTSVFISGPRFLVKTYGINTGTALILLYRSSNRTLIRYWKATAAKSSTVPVGGLVYYAISSIPPCSGSSTTNAYFRVQDPVSTRKSDRKYVCAKY
jgi:hypothetical protein